MNNIVGIMPSAYAVGAASLNPAEGTRKAPLLDTATIQDALEDVYSTDAHFVMYHITDADGHLVPYSRCNKSILPDLLGEGAQALLSVIGIDWDNPEHQHWSPELIKERDGIIKDLMGTNELMGKMFAAYRSRAGYRFVFVLDEPVPVLEGERYIAGVLKELKAIGIDADDLSDWTRLFRLPFVVREGQNTWDQDSCMLEVYGNTLALSDVTPCDRGEVLVPTSTPLASNSAFPTDDEAANLLEFTDNAGRRKPTALFREFKKSLQGRKCFSCIYEDQPMADEGGRNQAMMSFIGEVIPVAMDMDGCSPEFIFAMFLPAVLDFEADQDWRRSLWTGIINIWNMEKVKFEGNFRVKLEAKAEKADGMRSVIDGMQGWDDSEELRGAEQNAYARRQMIANMGKIFFLIQLDGSYSAKPLTKDQLIPEIRRSRVSELIPTARINDKGQSSDISVLSIINSYVVPVREIERIPDTGKSGFIKNHNSNHPLLVLPMYRLNPHLVPTFNDGVDQWLKAFFGKEYEEGIKWIAYALAFEDGPTCSLSIKGSQGTGKNLFVHGLSECLEIPFTATATDLTSQFQGGLLRSPFLWVDEGWPQTRSGLSPADQFRRVTGGGGLPINDKFMPVQRVFNPMRAIFTANNGNVVQELANGNDQSPEDREAIAIRLLHYDIGGAAAEHLEKLGGRRHTSKKGSKWVADDSGESDFILAKHFLWIYGQKDRWAKGARFAVEGNIAKLDESNLMFEMLVSHGKTPLVMETAIYLYESADSRPGCVVEDGKLYVLISEIVTHLRDNNYAEARIRSSDVANALKNLVVTDPFPQTLRSRKSQGEREWYQLDTDLLLRASVKFGYNSMKLQKNCKGAK